MRTARLQLTRAGANTPGPRISLKVSEKEGDPFADVAAEDLPAGLVPAQAVADPDEPAQPLSIARARELAAAADVPQAVSRFLYDVLLRGAVRRQWEALRKEGPLRTELDVDGDAVALAVPWERMQDEDDEFVALDPHSPFVRVATPLTEPPPSDWPIRVLVAYCVNPDGAQGGAQRIDAAAERLALERLFASPALRYDVEYDVLEHPTRARLVEACREARPHVLHFIGHADASAQAAAADHALLLWQPATGTYDDWKPADIRTSLRKAAPRLVFLNACNSGGGAAMPSATANLAHAFLKAGSVAALAMQGEIAGDLAKAFALAFYRSALERRQDVDVAVAEARLAMAGTRAAADLQGDPDWAFPVLVRRVAADHVLPKAPDLRGTPVGRGFVSRLQERREAHAAIRCREIDRPPLLIVKGQPRSGKSHLAGWSAHACEREGLRVVNVTFVGQEKVDWLDALRWIRDGLRPIRGRKPERLASHPLPALAFREFNWQLNRQLRGLESFEAPPPGPVEDEGLALSDGKDTPPAFPESMLSMFVDALGQCASDAGLVLVLDDLDGVEAHALRDRIIGGLARPIARGAPGLARVRMILVMSHEQHAECADAITSAAGRVVAAVELKRFLRSEYTRLARQFCHLSTLGMQDAQADIIEQFSQLLLAQHGGGGDTWGADLFKWLEKMLATLEPAGAAP